MDTVLADSIDHDPSFGIRDGNFFIGLHQTDRTNYHNRSPCLHIEGDKKRIFLQNEIAPNGPTVNSRAFTSEAKIQIRPTEKWGFCHTEDTLTLLTINVNLTSLKDCTLRCTAMELMKISYQVHDSCC